MKNAASLLIFLCALAAVAIAGDFKTEIITNATLGIDVPDHHFLRIYNFTQQNNGSVSQRGVVIASAATPTTTPTPTPAPTPTCSPSPCTPTPTPTPTPIPTTTPTPTPTPPPRAVLTATMISSSSASPLEFIKHVVIDGPAHVTVDPLMNATLVLTYKRELEPTPTPTPAPITTATPSPTPTATPMVATIISSTILTDDVSDE